MITILLFMICNLTPHLAQDFIGGDNPIKEAVRLLQVERLNIVKEELKEVKIDKDKVVNEKILIEQKVEQLQNQHDKEIRTMKEKFEEEISGLKAINTKKE